MKLLKIPVVVLMLAYTLPVLAQGQGNVGAGEVVFEICSVCHGEQAEGIEDFDAPRLGGQRDWYLALQLENFRAGFRGTNDGDDNGQVMQPMAADLSDEDIADVVAYIMTLAPLFISEDE